MWCFVNSGGEEGECETIVLSGIYRRFEASSSWSLWSGQWSEDRPLCGVGHKHIFSWNRDDRPRVSYASWISHVDVGNVTSSVGMWGWPEVSWSLLLDGHSDVAWYIFRCWWIRRADLLLHSLELHSSRAEKNELHHETVSELFNQIG